MAVIPDHHYPLTPVDSSEDLRRSPISDAGLRKAKPSKKREKKKGVANMGFENIPDIKIREYAASEEDYEV